MESTKTWFVQQLILAYFYIIK